MNAQKFLEEKVGVYLEDDLLEPTHLSYGEVIEVMGQYHQSKVNNGVSGDVISSDYQRYFELIDKRNKIAEEHPLMRMHDFLRMYEVEEIDKEIKSLNISCL